MIEPENVEAETQEKLVDPDDIDTRPKKGEGLVSMRPQSGRKQGLVKTVGGADQSAHESSGEKRQLIDANLLKQKTQEAFASIFKPKN